MPKGQEDLCDLSEISALRHSIYSVEAIKRVSIIVSDNVLIVFFSALKARLPQNLWTFFMWSV
jgi:hypothetical protein